MGSWFHFLFFFKSNILVFGNMKQNVLVRRIDIVQRKIRFVKLPFVLDKKKNEAKTSVLKGSC